jgi:hypothetical protein
MSVLTQIAVDIDSRIPPADDDGASLAQFLLYLLLAPAVSI